MIACMGGWCAVRDRCAHYHARSGTPVERLCARGDESPKPARPGPKFDAVLAGATAEPQARWERISLKREEATDGV